MNEVVSDVWLDKESFIYTKMDKLMHENVERKITIRGIGRSPKILDIDLKKRFIDIPQAYLFVINELGIYRLTNSEETDSDKIRKAELILIELKAALNK